MWPCALLLAITALIGPARAAATGPIAFLPPVGDTDEATEIAYLMHARAERLLIEGGTAPIMSLRHVLGAAEVLHAAPSSWFEGENRNSSRSIGKFSCKEHLRSQCRTLMPLLAHVLRWISLDAGERRPKMSFSHVLIAIDEGPLASRVVDLLIRLAATLGAQMALVHVVDLRPAVGPEPGAGQAEELRQHGLAWLDAAIDRAGGSSRVLGFLRDGLPADEILATAHEWGADLIVMGTHGRSGLRQVVIGRTAEAVMRQARCPVLVIKAGQEPSQGAA